MEAPVATARASARWHGERRLASLNSALRSAEGIRFTSQLCPTVHSLVRRESDAAPFGDPAARRSPRRQRSARQRERRHVRRSASERRSSRSECRFRRSARDPRKADVWFRGGPSGSAIGTSGCKGRIVRFDDRSVRFKDRSEGFKDRNFGSKDRNAELKGRNFAFEGRNSG